jgi:hypothetical protein
MQNNTLLWDRECYTTIFYIFVGKTGEKTTNKIEPAAKKGFQATVMRI